MKRGRISNFTGSAILASTAIIVLLACKNPFIKDNAPVYGSISIQTQGSDEFGAKTLRPDVGSLQIATYYYHLVGPGGVTVDGSDASSAKTFADLVVGSWTVTVTAKNASTTTLLSSAAIGFTVSQGQTASVTVPLTAETGDGTVNLTITLPAFVAQVSGTIDDDASPGTPESINGKIAFTSPIAIYTDTLPAGTYLLSLSFKNAQGKLIGMIIEDLDVFAGIAVNSTLTLRDIDLNQPPAAPASLAATAGDQQISLEYTSVYGATGYNVYYKVNSDTATTADTLATGSPFTNLTPTIAGLYKGTKYTFVVTAVNVAGEGAASAAATAMTLGLPNYGLVAEYLFNGNANDTSGYANNGVISEGITKTTDRFGISDRAYNFDGGLNHHITVTPSSAIDFHITHEFSVSTWVNVLYMDNGSNFIYQDNGGYTFIHRLGNQNGKVSGGVVQGTWWYGISSNSFLNTEQWHHLIMTSNETETKIYLDNVYITGISYSSISWGFNPSDIIIGGAFDDAESPTNGKIDDVRIYNRVLSGSEIQALYQDNGWPLVLSYDGNGNTSGVAPASVNCWDGTAVTVSDNSGSLVKMQDGISFRFAGWNTQANGGGTAYAPGATFTMGASDATLFAQWSYMRGTGPSGGLVFFDKGSVSDGWRYLEAAPSDQSAGTTWYNGSNVGTGASGTDTGTGTGNSAKIRATQGVGSYAAGLCAELTLGGYGDWFLPSTVELDLMRQNLHLQSAGGFAAAAYWTSTETADSTAWSQNFSTGAQTLTQKNDAAVRVRAVRAFRSVTPTHVVLYYGNSFTGGSVPADAKLYEEGESVTAASVGTMSKQNNGFAGWNTAADGSGTHYSAGSTFAMGTDNMVLYAQWAMSHWSKTYGGTGGELFRSIVNASGNGFFATGYSNSYGIGTDMWIARLDNDGNILWQKAYGGSALDGGFNALSLGNGLLVTGFSNSYGIGGNDVWITKLDNYGGIIWQKAYGGTAPDGATAIDISADGGYLIGAGTWSFTSGMDDYGIIKLDGNGNIVWQKAYGGSDRDYQCAIKEMANGDIILAGTTVSFGNLNEIWVIKVNNVGTIIWEKTFGGSGQDTPVDYEPMIVTSDNNVIIVGKTNSFGAGAYDFWVIKLNADGNIIWEKRYGGANDELAASVIELSNGNYLVSGITSSFGSISDDGWLIELQPDGNIVWQKRYGENDMDYLLSIRETEDGGLIASGYSKSYGAGQEDAWILKMTAAGSVPPFGIATDATAVNTNCTVNNTNCTITTPNYTVTNLSVNVADTACTVLQQAPVGSSGFTMTGGLLQDYAVNLTVTGALGVLTPDAAGNYPLYTISQASLPITVSVASTPAATAFQWLLNGSQQPSSISSIVISSLAVQNHYLTLRLKNGTDAFRSATIILKATN